jgi:hypothetical protein
MQQLDYKNERSVFPMWSVQGEKSVDNEFCTTVCEERTSAGGKGIAIVGAVTRKQLVTDLEY